MGKPKYCSKPPCSPRNNQSAKRITEPFSSPRQAYIVDNKMGLYQYCKALEFIQYENGKQYYLVEYIDEKQNKKTINIALDKIEFI